mmetsp:Transcript_21949/g.28941  ORF Transcript_21949/g.28941 Transcript_21949/m.28941 type:complete len:167 (-) Transcript_21949:153-653(-)
MRDSFSFSPFQGGRKSHMTPTVEEEEEAEEKSSSEILHDQSMKTAFTKPKKRVPKLLLLTVANKPTKPYQLWADVNDLSPVYSWVNTDDGSLDGVYLQFQQEMLSPEGANEMRGLASSLSSPSNPFSIGVWGHNGRDPDDFETFHKLVKECAVSYVNTDLPRAFKE